MKEESLQRLIDGYKEFRKEYADEQYKDYRVWAAKEQKPPVMMIACSDSRVNPAILTNSRLGEIFVVNNVANLVPPYKEDGSNTHHSTSAALEFAINHLQVEHVIILGHSGCGGIRALMGGNVKVVKGVYSFIEPWMNIACKAKDFVLQKYGNRSFEEQLSLCEKESLLVSLRNLKTFPWLIQAVEQGALSVHAWYFTIETGKIQTYCDKQNAFIPLVAE